MAGPRQTIIRMLRRCSEWSAQARRAEAVIRITPGGAEVELANGTGCTFSQSDLTEPALEAALRWARRRGAATISIRR